jgi:hypothetical protein
MSVDRCTTWYLNIIFNALIDDQFKFINVSTENSTNQFRLDAEHELCHELYYASFLQRISCLRWELALPHYHRIFHYHSRWWVMDGSWLWHTCQIRTYSNSLLNKKFDRIFSKSYGQYCMRSWIVMKWYPEKSWFARAKSRQQSIMILMCFSNRL